MTGRDSSCTVHFARSPSASASPGPGRYAYDRIVVHPPYEPPDDLPSFGDPPVAEAVLGVEFETVPDLGAVQLVRLAARYDRYPTIQERPGTPPSVGPGEEAVAEFALMTGAPPLRLWLLSEGEQDLVQLQSDRVLLNWRGFVPAAGAYPRYAYMRTEYLAVWDTFLSHLDELALSGPRPTFVESSFVNMYALTGDGPSASGLSFVSDIPESMPGTDSSFRFELVRTVTGVNGARGRTSIAGAPQQATDEGERKYQLNVTTKLQVPPDADLASLAVYLDSAHDLSVRAFSATTDVERHHEWRREA